MIHPDDTHAFNDIINATWQSLQRNNLPENSTKKYWFSNLQEFSLGDVAEAFDKYIMNAPKMANGTYILPSINDIKNLCKPKPNQFALPKPSPLTADEQRANVEKVKTLMAENLKPKTNYHSWFIRILRNPKQFPNTSVDKAKKAAISFGYDINELMKGAA